MNDSAEHRKGKFLTPEEIAARYFKRYSWEECDQDSEKYKSTHQYKELLDMIKQYGEYCYESGLDTRVRGIENKVKSAVGKVKIATRIIYTAAVLFALLLVLLEIKRYYNIDLIPDYDSPVDDIYGAIRGTMTDVFK